MGHRVLVLLLLLGAIAAAGAGEPEKPAGADLPPGWSVRKAVTVPPDQLEAIGQRLGGRLVSLENDFLDLNGFPARWNDVRAADDASAESVYRTMLGMRGSDFVARRGLSIYEVAGDNVLVARRVRFAKGVPSASEATYEVTLRLALVDDLVESERNDVFNLFLRLERNPDDEAVAASIRKATSDWAFGRTLRVRTPRPPLDEATWTFVPEPSGREVDGSETRYTFEDPPRTAGVPFVTARVSLRVASRFEPSPGKAPSSLRTETPLWPSAPVAAVVRDAATGAPTPRLRVLALLRALSSDVRYGGKMGSRDPVAAVLARGYGQCFDKTDVFIASCRALGIPARLVAGWVPPLGAGHVWAEVFLEGEGWIPVDATTTWLGTSFDYLPFFQSKTGPAPFLYVAAPVVKRVS